MQRVPGSAFRDQACIRAPSAAALVPPRTLHHARHARRLDLARSGPLRPAGSHAARLASVILSSRSRSRTRSPRRSGSRLVATLLSLLSSPQPRFLDPAMNAAHKLPCVSPSGEVSTDGQSMHSSPWQSHSREAGCSSVLPATGRSSGRSSLELETWLEWSRRRAFWSLACQAFVPQRSDLLSVLRWTLFKICATPSQPPQDRSP